jgi:hypothetical protein
MSPDFYIQYDQSIVGRFTFGPVSIESEPTDTAVETDEKPSPAPNAARR